MLYETVEMMARDAAAGEIRPKKIRDKSAKSVAKLDNDATAFLKAHGFGENGEKL